MRACPFQVRLGESPGDRRGECPARELLNLLSHCQGIWDYFSHIFDRQLPVKRCSLFRQIRQLSAAGDNN